MPAIDSHAMNKGEQAVYLKKVEDIVPGEMIVVSNMMTGCASGLAVCSVEQNAVEAPESILVRCERNKKYFYSPGSVVLVGKDPR
jgi:hypothetical protein